MNMRATAMGVLWAGLVLAAFSAAGDLRVQVYAYDVNGEREYLDALAREFAAAPGGAPVEIALGKWDDAHAAMKAWIEAGEGPDLVVTPDIWLAEFAAGIEPFGPHLDPAVAADFFPVLHEKGVYNGALLGPVWATSTKALFYRTDLFAAAGMAPPTNWMEQLAAAVALNDPPRVYGIGLPGSREYETDDNLFFYFWSAGGRFFDDAGKFAMNSDAGVRSLQFYCDLVNRYRVTQPEVTTWNRKQCRRLFEQGRLAMFATGPWGVESLRKNAPDIPFGVVPLPADQERVTQIITDHLVLLRSSEQKELAARFVNFAYRREHRLAYAKLGLIPELRSVAADPYFQNDPEWKVFIDVIPDGRVIPLITWEPVGAAIREAMFQALSGRKPVREALDDLCAEVDALTER